MNEGLLYSRGNTTLEDSLYWLKKAAKRDAFAQYAAGVILLSGSSASLFESESLEKVLYFATKYLALTALENEPLLHWRG